MADMVRWYLEPSSHTYKVLWKQPALPLTEKQVAMKDTCCCDWNGSAPGYAIYARDCCTGVASTTLYLDLTHPPVSAFTRVWSDGTNCWRFDPRDLIDMILLTDPSFTGTDPFSSHYGSWTSYSGCTPCRCAGGNTPCCYDFINYPDWAGSRDSDTLRYYEFSGLQLHSAVEPCRSTVVLFDPVDSSLLYCKVELPTGLPTGPYTGSQNIDCTHGTSACEPPLLPSNTTITSYWKDAGCTVPSARPDDVECILVTYDYVGLSGIPAQTGNSGVVTNNRIFDITSAGLIPNPLCEPITIPNPVTSEGTDAGYGGSVTITPCCPDEPGGV